MSKFKVGDKVRILDGSNIENYTGKWCAAGMEEYVGKTRTVENMWPEDNGRTAYSLSGIPFKWDERGLELAEDEPKFKAGDKIIANEKANERYGVTRQGWTGVVTWVDCNGQYIDARGRGDTAESVVFRTLRADCFDLDKVVSTQKIVITTDGKKTTAKLYNGKTVVKTAQASCAPSDDFDFKFGASLALDRLTGFVRGSVECTLEEKSDWDKFLAGEIVFEMDKAYYNAFLQEVEKRFPNIRWCGGEKPTDWKPGNSHCYFRILDGDLCYGHSTNDVKRVQWSNPLDWNKFAHGELEVKVSKESFGEFMKQCEAKNFHWSGYRFAASFNPWEEYKKLEGFAKLMTDAIGQNPREYVWVSFDADDDSLKFGATRDGDCAEYEFV